ncbi:hypothetical protein EDC01DRAFT_122998 [Geopyxis carbonaria]|nr:hypothetical protein EDC01DRAFT_122998 [Geopyxis carbonaria]
MSWLTAEKCSIDPWGGLPPPPGACLQSTDPLHIWAEKEQLRKRAQAIGATPSPVSEWELRGREKRSTQKKKRNHTPNEAELEEQRKEKEEEIAKAVAMRQENTRRLRAKRAAQDALEKTPVVESEASEDMTGVDTGDSIQKDGRLAEPDIGIQDMDSTSTEQGIQNADVVAQPATAKIQDMSKTIQHVDNVDAQNMDVAEVAPAETKQQRRPVRPRIRGMACGNAMTAVTEIVSISPISPPDTAKAQPDTQVSTFPFRSKPSSQQVLQQFHRTPAPVSGRYAATQKTYKVSTLLLKNPEDPAHQAAKPRCSPEVHQAYIQHVLETTMKNGKLPRLRLEQLAKDYRTTLKPHTPPELLTTQVAREVAMARSVNKKRRTELYCFNTESQAFKVEQEMRQKLLQAKMREEDKKAMPPPPTPSRKRRMAVNEEPSTETSASASASMPTPQLLKRPILPAKSPRIRRGHRAPPAGTPPLQRKIAVPYTPRRLKHRSIAELSSHLAAMPAEVVRGIISRRGPKKFLDRTVLTPEMVPANHPNREAILRVLAKNEQIDRMIRDGTMPEMPPPENKYPLPVTPAPVTPTPVAPVQVSPAHVAPAPVSTAPPPPSVPVPRMTRAAARKAATEKEKKVAKDEGKKQPGGTRKSCAAKK